MPDWSDDAIPPLSEADQRHFLAFHQQKQLVIDRVVSVIRGRSEISENTQLSATNASVVKLYERWLQTGSRRAATLLAERGITPVVPGDGRPQ